MSQVLSQLHKLLYIDQLPPSMERDPRRKVVQSYKRQLFGRHRNAGTIKSEFIKLVRSSPELVESSGVWEARFGLHSLSRAS